MSFRKQALENLSGTHQLEKYQAVTKDDVLGALKTYFLPMFDPSSSIAVVVAAPVEIDEIGEGLEALGGFFFLLSVCPTVKPSDVENHPVSQPLGKGIE